MGLTGVVEAVRIDDMARFDGAFICNSATPACPVGNIDGRSLDVDPVLMDRLEAAWATNAPQPI